MKNKNTSLKNFIQWILASVLAFVLANILILPYWYAPGWVSRDTGATPAIYHAGKTVINGYEGYGWAHYAKEEETFLYKITDAFKGGLDVIVGLITLWPLYIIAGVIVYFVRKRKLKKAKKNDE